MEGDEKKTFGQLLDQALNNQDTKRVKIEIVIEKQKPESQTAEPRK